MNDKTEQLKEECWKWSKEIFGDHMDPRGTLNHLKEEIDELLEQYETCWLAIKENIDLDEQYKLEKELFMEWADIWTLVLDAITRAGMSIEDINNHGFAKLEINKNRLWGEPDENGIVRHIK